MARRRDKTPDDARISQDGVSQGPAPSSNTGSDTITVHVPLTFSRRGGRKRMLAPDGKPVVPAARSAAPADTPVVRALARAFRWRKMIEAGDYATVGEIADAEGVNGSYVSRVLRLTLLAPGILERLIEWSVPDNGLTVEALLKPLPVSWRGQLETFSNVAA